MLATSIRKFGNTYPNTTNRLSFLGRALMLDGRKTEALSKFRAAIEIIRNQLGANHPYSVDSEHNYLVSAYETDPAKYEKKFLKSLKRIRNDPSIKGELKVLAYANMSEFLRKKLDYSGAKRELRRSIDLFSSVGMHNNELLMEMELDYSELLFMAGDRSQADVIAGKYMNNIISNFIREGAFLSTPKRHLYYDNFLRKVESQVALRVDKQASSPFLAWLLLNSKGLVQEMERSQYLLTIEYSKSEQVRKLQDIDRQLDSLLLSKSDRLAITAMRDDLIAQLFERLPGLQVNTFSMATIAQAIPSDGVLVEFRRFRSCDSHKQKDQPCGPAQYIALILKQDLSFVIVNLGSAAAVDDIVSKALSATGQNQTDATTSLRIISEKVLLPLKPYLKESKSWFLSLDGELNKVPFAVLPNPILPDKNVESSVQLHLITTARDLIRLQQPSKQARKALVMANPSYDHNRLSLGGSVSLGDYTQLPKRPTAFKHKKWNQLTATQFEGDQVAELLSTRAISGEEATAKKLRLSKSPIIVHIATHGFFTPSQGIEKRRLFLANRELVFQLQGVLEQDPMNRAGLVFAGANHQEANSDDDGYLTAAEAAMLQLDGTELVVLSACSTAEGTVQNGEGVYGLQRSLTVAGARSTLLSLWKVDDAATAEFMIRFYKRLKSGEARSDALAATQKEFRDGTAGRGQWKEPYYWAAWQLVGDWRPIKGL